MTDNVITFPKAKKLRPLPYDNDSAAVAAAEASASALLGYRYSPDDRITRQVAALAVVFGNDI